MNQKQPRQSTKIKNKNEYSELAKYSERLEAEQQTDRLVKARTRKIIWNQNQARKNPKGKVNQV